MGDRYFDPPETPRPQAAAEEWPFLSSDMYYMGTHVRPSQDGMRMTDLLKLLNLMRDNNMDTTQITAYVKTADVTSAMQLMVSALYKMKPDEKAELERQMKGRAARMDE